MRRWLVPILAALVAAALTAAFAGAYSDDTSRSGSGPSGKGARSYDIGLWGDLPYSDEQKTVGVPNLVADMNDQPLAFSVFDGDLKNGRTVCDDAVFSDAIARLNSLEAPAVYVPGDNEWTDCHRKNNNNSPPDAAKQQPYDNLERLAYLRKTMFAEPESFGQRTLRLTRQSDDYPENVRWRRGGVVYASVHVVGSDNNRIVDVNVDESAFSHRTTAQRVADQQEFEARDAAGVAWVRAAFADAERTGAPAVMLVIQANPIFNSPDTPDDDRAKAGDDGFKRFLDTLREETVGFDGQVVLVHGDSHYFRIDKPLYDAQGRRIENFTRLETFGENDPHWVKVTVDPRSREVFSFEPQIVPANVVDRAG